MSVTIESVPQKKAKDGKSTATPRSIEVTMRFDLTGGVSLSGTKLVEVLNAIVDSSKEAVTSRGLDVAAVDGDWAWVYGPWSKGRIS